MEYNAQDIAAVWFVVVFSVMLIAPLLGLVFRAVWNLGR